MLAEGIYGAISDVRYTPCEVSIAANLNISAGDIVNMALENGKYYIQNSTIYLCNRDTINPVYNTLSELVGLYVEIV